MVYKGYKINIRCTNWEQVKVIDKFWNICASEVGFNNLIGLGMNWTEDYLYFDYALGAIKNDVVVKKLGNIDFKSHGFNAEYIEINLPDEKEWQTFRGKDFEVKEIYEKEIDCYNKKYDYELEYIDEKGNIEIRIHFIE